METKACINMRIVTILNSMDFDQVFLKLSELIVSDFSTSLGDTSLIICHLSYMDILHLITIFTPSSF